MALERGSRIGQFEIGAPLGKGGMGEVYLARDLELDRDVAIKILPPRLMDDAESLARFDREARMLAALNHPNVAAIYRIEQIAPPPGSSHPPGRALVLELVEGETLADRISRGPLPLAEALAIARQIANALDAAHEKGIVHRDLKPANVKVTPAGVVKVLDFGLAKLTPFAAQAATSPTVTVDETQAGVILGTAAYMSPEQARGQLVDKRTDIWAFGCVLFELLTGSRAFDRESLSETFAAVLERPPAWERLPPATPPAVRRVLQRCLEKDPVRRARDIGDVRQELNADAGAPAQRPPWRRWVLAGTVAAAVVAVAVGFGFSRAGFFDRASRVPQVRSVAVLPLVDLSSGSDEGYFADGMTDELIAALSKIRAWRVISRTSVMQYRGANKPLPVIAKELGVDALVEGTVQRANGRVRITVRLIRAGPAEESVWTDSYDRDLRDVLDLEADVALAIAGQIKLTLTPAEAERLNARRPVDPELFQVYLKGRAAIDRGSERAITEGIGYFEQVLQKDPKYAPAHAAMAMAYGRLNPSYRRPKDVMPKARQYAARAIELDDTLSEAHTALADVLFRYDWNWSSAEQAIRHAIDLNPSSADAHELYGNFLVAVGEQSKAVTELQVARELNPSALTTVVSLLGAYVTGRQYDRAIQEAQRTLATNPDFAFAHAWLGMAHVLKGQFAEAIPALTRARDLDENVTTVHFLAMAQAAAGNRAEAERLLRQLETAAANRYTCAYEVASVHLLLGRTEQAVQWLRRGVDEQCDCMVWLKTEPWMDPLRIDARYADLIKRVGFPQR